ncbi:hypothetical protein [Sulfobacillus thermosulfidooxidans]|uniref:hypothetical protein n=1 Tax=Sulfobacillus thermosulfidooxidans TaxID=28034 RepID=UPI001593E8D7|nr:hypothetical protein [Sulfobacillus thermosulfidooxidans]
MIPGRSEADPAIPYVGVWAETDDPAYTAYAAQVAAWWVAQHPGTGVVPNDSVQD